MKALPAGLQAHLDAGVTTLARCWRVERRDSAVFGFTNHDRVLSFAGTDYAPETGFSAGEMQFGLGLAVDTDEVEGALSADAIDPDDIAKGLWDDAEVEIWLVNWGDVAQRVLLRRGSLGEVSRSEIGFAAEIRGLAHRLNQERGRIYARQCDAVVGDARCTVALAAAGFHGDGTVISADDRRILIVDGLEDFDDGWFALGLLTWTSGANAGASIELRRHHVDGGAVRLTLWQRAALAIAPGDGFSVTAGCDKTFATCKAKFANTANFRGFPHIPGNDFSLGVAKKDQTNDGGSFFNG